MKDNHVPASDRLRDRITKLSIREEDAWVKIGGGNPYLKCKHCGVTNVEETIRGHYAGCLIKGIPNEIAHYKRLLAELNKGQ